MDKIEIYVGDLIQYESERVALQALLKRLEQIGRPAIVLCNFTVSSTQIDFVVAVNSGLFVFEIKGNAYPLRGQVNGHWEKLTSNGEWIPIRNYYAQALGASYAIKDGISVNVPGLSYPSAILLFTSDLHRDSVIPTSDFKVTRLALSELTTFSFANSTSNVSLDEVRKFAMAVNLLKRSIQELFDEKLLRASIQLTSYCNAFVETYQTEMDACVSLDCIVDNNVIQSDTILKSITTNQWLIKGKSGCGKTILAKKIAIDLANKKLPVVYLEAKHYEGSFRKILDEEVALLGIKSGKDLISIVERLSNELFIIIDGLNESSPLLRRRLVRSLNALTKRNSVKLIVVSQDNSAEVDLLKLKVIEVPTPSFEIKRSIAKVYAPEVKFHVFEPLLEAVSTCIEASIVGQIAEENFSGASRFALFDYYIRHKLSDIAYEGISLLVAIAQWMNEQVTFSITIRELHRRCIQSKISLDTLESLIHRNILHRNFDKISFAHELFLNTYISESIIRSNSFEEILSAINKPTNKGRAEFIFGAIEDHTIIKNILPQVKSVELINHIIEGHCGLFSKQCIINHYQHLFELIYDESNRLEFEFTEDHINPVVLKSTCVHPWTEHQRALIATIPKLIHEGLYMEELAASISLVDQSIRRNFQQMIEEAKLRKVSISSGLFAEIYVPFSQDNCAISIILSNATSLLFSPDKHKLAENVSKLFNAYTPPTNGQLYFFLTIGRFSQINKILFPYIKSHLAAGFKYLPYHLSILILDCVARCWTTQEQRLELITLLDALPQQSNIFMSSSVVDALVELGALEKDEEEYLKVTKEEIQAIVQHSNDSSRFSEAWNFYIRQFDHPYHRAYYESIQNINAQDRAAFLEMALKGAAEDQHGDLFVTSLIVTAMETIGERITPILKKWCNAPDLSKGGFIQDRENVFFLSYLILAQYKVPHTSNLNSTDRRVDNVLYACADICYWTHRKDLPAQVVVDRCGPAWTFLTNPEIGLAMEALWKLTKCLSDIRSNYSLSVENWEINTLFTSQIAKVCRETLIHPDKLQAMTVWDKPETVIDRAIYTLGLTGNISDLTILRQFASNTSYSATALQAIRTIEGL